MKTVVHVSANGTDYPLKFGAAAMAEYEAKYNRPVSDILTQFEALEKNELNMTDMIELMRICLRQPDTDSGREIACDVIDELGLIGMAEKLADVILSAFPEPEQGAASGDAPAGNAKKPAPKK